MEKKKSPKGDVDRRYRQKKGNFDRSRNNDQLRAKKQRKDARGVATRHRSRNLARRRDGWNLKRGGGDEELACAALSPRDVMLVNRKHMRKGESTTDNPNYGGVARRQAGGEAHSATKKKKRSLSRRVLEKGQPPD